MWRLADGEDGGDQVIQRPGQVVLSGQDNLVIDAKMVDRPSRNRVVGRWGCQGRIYRQRTSRRCQRSNVPGVTSRLIRRGPGSSRAWAASTAQSARSSLGLGFCRHSTAISWHNTSSSASLRCWQARLSRLHARIVPIPGRLARWSSLCQSAGSRLAIQWSPRFSRFSFRAANADLRPGLMILTPARPPNPL
jgi:hypothetical protein